MRRREKNAGKITEMDVIRGDTGREVTDSGGKGKGEDVISTKMESGNSGAIIETQY